MIVLSILVIISFSFGSGFITKIGQMRFQKKVQKVQNKILFCKEMAQIRGIDTQLVFRPYQGDILMRAGTDSDHGLFNKGTPLDEKITNVEVYLNDKQGKKFTLLFSSTGVIFPEGGTITVKDHLSHLEEIDLQTSPRLHRLPACKKR
jgi:hypothetical protein